MKTIILSLLIASSFSSTALFAQPTITTNEFYYIGDVIQMINCDPGSFDAGASGADVTWDYTTLAPIGDPLTSTVLHDTSATYITANLLVNQPNGIKQHIQENSTDSYLLASVDSTSGLVIDYNNYDISKRPITYMTVFTDTYRVNITATGAFGGGHLTTAVDAYGTLKIPTGTYSNVLRVKKVQQETDTIGTTMLTTTTISYLWFDAIHHPPLLRIDSVIGVIGAGNTIMYMAGPAGIPNYNSSAGNYLGYMHSSELLLTGTFDAGKLYRVSVYNIIGVKVYEAEFAATANSARFDMNRVVNDGIYIVSIAPKNDPLGKEVIKVAKQ